MGIEIEMWLNAAISFWYRKGDMQKKLKKRMTWGESDKV